MIEYPSILLTFLAGIFSFFSPCVFPLIPSYLSILGASGGIAISKNNSGTTNEVSRGTSGEDSHRQENKNRLVLFFTTVFFILGFSVVFNILSIIISTTFLLMGGITRYIYIAAGIIVIILGFNVIFDFISFLNYEKKLRITKKPKGYAGAFIAGIAFGAGWTPCIGPILTSVLLLAGQSGMAGIASLYLLIYSLGLGMPFLITALFFDRFLVTAKWFRDKLPVIKKVCGILLIIMGLLILTGRFSALNAALQRWQFQYIYWAQDKILPFRILADWLNWINF